MTILLSFMAILVTLRALFLEVQTSRLKKKILDKERDIKYLRILSHGHKEAKATLEKLEGAGMELNEFFQKFLSERNLEELATYVLEKHNPDEGINEEAFSETIDYLAERIFLNRAAFK